MKLNKSYIKNEVDLLIQGDSLKILKKIDSGSVDHCITDPPYNISGYDNKKKIGWLESNKYWTGKKNFQKIDESWDSFTNEEYLKFTRDWFREITRTVKVNGNILIFGSIHNIFSIAQIVQEEDKKILDMIVWYKRNAFPNITHRMLCNSTEYVLWIVNNNQKDAKKWVFNYDQLKKENVIKRCNKCKKTLDGKFVYCPFCGNANLTEDNLQMRNMWDIVNTPNRERVHGKHPSQKPEELIKKLVISSTNKSEVIIDPFVGSGTIPFIAKKLGRKFIAIEKEKEYCQIALKRLNTPVTF